MTSGSTNHHERYRRLPKVDLHRHLEGSLRLATMLELIRGDGIGLPSDEGALRARVQIVEGEPHTWAVFLSKFETLRQFYRSPEIIRRVVAEAVADAAADNVRYLELHFTPAALARLRDYPLAELTDWVVEAAREAARAQGIQVGLIASINRHEPLPLAEQVAQLASDRVQAGIVGLDLAGNEVKFPAEPFRSIFAAARQAGLGVTIHAGEWTGAASVRYALEAMQAMRIAHGGRVMEDPSVVALARERRAVFEVCLTSNLHSGVVASVEQHPLSGMLEAGLQVTLNTDDPGISDIRLSDEYSLACRAFDLSMESLKGLVLAAAQAAFLPLRPRQALEAQLQQMLFPAA